jgi:hypothetical protein
MKGKKERTVTAEGGVMENGEPIVKLSEGRKVIEMSVDCAESVGRALVHLAECARQDALTFAFLRDTVGVPEDQAWAHLDALRENREADFNRRESNDRA